MIVFFQELTSIGNRNRARTQAGAAERPSVERVQNSLTENEKRIQHQGGKVCRRHHLGQH